LTSRDILTTEQG